MGNTSSGWVAKDPDLRLYERTVGEMKIKDKAALYDCRTKNITSDIPSLIRLLKAEENILEVGSGTGRVLKQLAVHGFQNVNGVELDEAFFEASLLKLKPYMNQVSVYKINLLDTNLLQIFGDKRFDKIIFPFNVFSEFIDIKIS